MEKKEKGKKEKEGLEKFKNSKTENTLPKQDVSN